jgi:hypothetical protein
MKKSLIAVLSALALMAFAPLASAEDVSLHLQAGAAEVLHASNADQVFPITDFTRVALQKVS